MFYRFGITVPANTSADNPLKTEVKITKGIIHRVSIRFPPGPQGLMHVQINRGLNQIWPSNPDESFASDNEPVNFSEHYVVKGSPLQLEVYAWNLDTVYDHLIIVRFGVLKEKFILRRIF